jgi:hypothetical protein
MKLEPEPQNLLAVALVSVVSKKVCRCHFQGFLLVQGVAPRLLGRAALSLVSGPTELSRCC